jgi:hypothetical protein
VILDMVPVVNVRLDLFVIWRLESLVADRHGGRVLEISCQALVDPGWRGCVVGKDMGPVLINIYHCCVEQSHWPRSIVSPDCKDGRVCAWCEFEAGCRAWSMGHPGHRDERKRTLEHGEGSEASSC